ncbi:tetratricopeptide repeat protein [Neorhodopirellula pilleata]|uniref:hypothetical protein n=1 Tax=Neorhodopirellula pilleata TaxID=2714738 RepID=UPI0011B4439E|nr:hypothetical protein [Neorhodopirellula pilleata]
MGVALPHQSTAPVATATQERALSKTIGTAFAVVLSFLVLFLYSPSFVGPYVYDDIGHLRGNSTLDAFPPSLSWTRAETRPVVMATFALERALFGESPSVHRIGNVLIHILTAILLFVLVQSVARFSLSVDDEERSETNPSTNRDATALACLVALLWAVHPLNTQAVAYIIQRCESLMGLCFIVFLLMLVWHQQSEQRRWLIVAGIFFVIGLWSKTVMVTALAVGPLFDRAFLAADWRMVWKRRGWLYGVPLAASVVAVVTLLPGLLRGDANVGFGGDAPPALPHIAAQADIVFRYLGMSLFPIGLNIDHGLTVPQPWVQFLPQIMSALAVVISGFVAGYFGYWKLAFFLLAPLFILAPTSSFIPTADLLVEHRMYLPLACIVTGSVFGARLLARRLRHSGLPMTNRIHRPVRWVAISSLPIVMLFSWGTWSRAHDYQSGSRLWYRSLIENPANPRAAQNLVNTATEEISSEALMQLYVDALASAQQRALPTSIILGRIGEELVKANRAVEATQVLQRSIAGDPTQEDFANRFYPPSTREEYASHHINHALALMQLGRIDEAAADLEVAFRIHDQSPLARAIAGDLMQKAGNPESAIVHFQRALQLRPQWPEVQSQLNDLLSAEAP